MAALSAATVFTVVVPVRPALAQGVGASIVYVEVTSKQAQYCASGFVFHRSGLVATCYHVVEFADVVRVRLADGKWYAAKVVGTDGINDLAVLQVATSDVAALRLAHVPGRPLGQRVVAYGYPLCGSLGATMTATSGEITAVRGAGEGQAYQLRLDAMPGNSGGPLLNEVGEAIGVVFLAVNPVKVFLLTGWLPSDPISFAVPVTRLEEITPGLARWDVFPIRAEPSASSDSPQARATAAAPRETHFWRNLAIGWAVLAIVAGVLWLALPGIRP